MEHPEMAASVTIVPPVIARCIEAGGQELGRPILRDADADDRGIAIVQRLASVLVLPAP